MPSITFHRRGRPAGKSSMAAHIPVMPDRPWLSRIFAVSMLPASSASPADGDSCCSRCSMIANVSSRHPSPVSAEMIKLLPFQPKSAEKTSGSAALRSSAGTRSILFNTSQRGLRYSASSYFLQLLHDGSRLARRDRRPRRKARCRPDAAAGACARDGAGTGGPAPRPRPRLRSGRECPRCTKLRFSSTRTTPRLGCSVVKG